MIPTMVTSLGGLALRSKKRTFSWAEAPAAAAKRIKTPKQDLVEEHFMVNVFLFPARPPKLSSSSKRSWHAANAKRRITFGEPLFLLFSTRCTVSAGAV